MDLLKEDIGWAKGLLWMDWGACIDRRNFTKFIIRKVLSEICFEWGQLRTFAVGRDWTLTRESAQHFPASGQRLFYWTSFSRVSLDDKHFCESCSNCQSERVGHSALPMSWKNTLLATTCCPESCLTYFARVCPYRDFWRSTNTFRQIQSSTSNASQPFPPYLYP